MKTFRRKRRKGHFRDPKFKTFPRQHAPRSPSLERLRYCNYSPRGVDLQRLTLSPWEGEVKYAAGAISHHLP